MFVWKCEIEIEYEEAVKYHCNQEKIVKIQRLNSYEISKLKQNDNNITYISWK